MREIGLSGLPLDSPYSGSAVYTRNLVPLLPEVAPDLTFRLFTRYATLAPDQNGASVASPSVAAYYIRPSPSLDASSSDHHGLKPSRTSHSTNSVIPYPLQTPFAHLNPGRGLGARLDKFVWEEIALPLASALNGESLLHSLYFAAPIISAAPLVVTIHDLIPLALPDYHRHAQSAWYSAFMARAVRRAQAIITVSEHAKLDIVHLLGIPPERIHVTYEAVGESFRPEGKPNESERIRERYGLPDRFFLYLGGAEKRKNIELLVRAWAKIAPQMKDREVGLVIVANFPPPDRLYPDIPGLARELGLVVPGSKTEPDRRGGPDRRRGADSREGPRSSAPPPPSRASSRATPRPTRPTSQQTGDSELGKEGGPAQTANPADGAARHCFAGRPYIPPGQILFLPYIHENDKPALYRTALGFCFPSYYEGFGLPPLEAMASGLPLLAADATSIPEIVGDGGILLPPDDTDGWAEAMLKLVDSEAQRAELRRRGLKGAGEFNWRRTAEETVAVYRQVLS